MESLRRNQIRVEQRQVTSNHSEIASCSNDESESDVESDTAQRPLPSLSHRFHHTSSILALIATSDTIYAGTQGGELLVYDAQTYEVIQTIQAHGGSILGFCLSNNGELLFSSAADRFVNVWNTTDLQHLAAIYSFYDVGDVFCVSYSSRLDTVYLGAQNTSIQWFCFKDQEHRPRPDPSSHPALRQDRFFDSSGPGGIRTPRRQSHLGVNDPRSSNNLEIPKSNIFQFAHYGYVYCTLLTKGSNAGLQNEEVLVSGGGDGLVKIWTMDEQENGGIREIGKLDDGRDGGDSVLTFIMDGTFLYCGRVDGEINVWDLETRQLLRNIQGPIEDIMTLAVGRGVLYCAFVDGQVLKFDERQEPLDKWRAHHGRALASGYVENDGRATYVTGGNDNSIAIWDVTKCYGVRPEASATSREQMLGSLEQLISYRSVSSDIECKSDCRRAASFLRALLKSFGAFTELINTDNGWNPIVFAKFSSHHNQPDKIRKRILFYGHYDVIRAETRSGTWRTDPFTMVGADGYVYGRGASDNKGPIMAAIFAVAELVAKEELNADIIFLLEGEEEQGSRGFREAVKRNKDLIGHIDWILLANSYWLDDGVPCLTYGLRGVLRATVAVSGGNPDLHSGVDGSRLLDEPMKDLVMLLSCLTGPKGRIEIPDFYKSILPVSSSEKLFYEEITRTLLARDPTLNTPDQLTASLMARWREANLTIHGFRTSGPQNATVIPNEAQATLSIRLVPDQNVEKINSAFKSFLEMHFAKMKSKNTLSITVNHTADPWLGDPTNKIFKTLEEATMDVWSKSEARNMQRRTSVTIPGSKTSRIDHRLSSATSFANRPSVTTSSNLVASSVTSPPLMPFMSTSDAVDDESSASSDSDTPALSKSTESIKRPDKSFIGSKSGLQTGKPLYIREGGSIPAVRFLEKEFNAPAAQLPCGQASDNAHLDNERLRVLNLYNSKEIFRQVFHRLPRK